MGPVVAVRAVPASGGALRLNGDFLGGIYAKALMVISTLRLSSPGLRDEILRSCNRTAMLVCDSSCARKRPSRAVVVLADAVNMSSRKSGCLRALALGFAH